MSSLHHASTVVGEVTKGEAKLSLHTAYGQARLDDRQINELIGLAHGIVADGTVNQAEAEYLQKWLAANGHVTENPIVNTLLHRVSLHLKDGILDASESEDLFDTLKAFTGGDFELGEIQKSTTLPLCKPAPAIEYAGNRFCFTGTFGYGQRKACETAVLDRGGSVGGISRKTNYLVIGIYATDSWLHSAYGRKIEEAASFRNQGHPVRIVGEEYWLTTLS
jgi:NAD-dependent DNA ligase